MLHADRHPARIVAAALLLGVAFLLALEWFTRPAATQVVGERFGYQPDPQGVADFLAELPQPLFRDAGAEAMRKSVEVDTFLFRSMDKAHRARYGKPFVVGRQGIGDCIAWGAMHAVFCAESVSWELGQAAEPPLMPASESIYGGARVESRGKSGDGTSPVGGWSDGATGWGAAKWLRDWGVVYRQQYETVDLTTYSADRAKAYGAYGNGGQGDAGRLDKVAKRHPCRHVVAVRTWEELVAAIGSGFPVTIASSVGFNSGPRDADGFCAASGTWMHQMSIISTRFAKNAPPGTSRPRDGALVLNSWGNYVAGGKFPPDQPDGSFWISRSDAERILAQGDSYAIGSVETGFKWRDLHNGNWFAPPPVETLTMKEQDR